MAADFKLTVITPTKIVFQDQAVSLVAPCHYGYLGVMAHHAAMAAHVVAGKITVHTKDGKTLALVTKEQGFLSVKDNEVSLLLRTVEAS